MTPQVLHYELDGGRFLLTVNSDSLEDARAAFDAAIADIATKHTLVVEKAVEASFPGLGEGRQHGAGSDRAIYWQVRTRGRYMDVAQSLTTNSEGRTVQPS